MMNFKNEEAVSPVIGVILMVAITVILAAVIAAFVFGMTGNVATTKTVAATTQISGDNVIVTYQGGPDHVAVASLACSAVDDDGNDLTPEPMGDFDPSAPTIGGKWSIGIDDLRAAGGNAIVTVTATFSDGTQQVILDKTHNIPKTP